MGPSMTADGVRVLADFAVASIPGNERRVLDQLAHAVDGCGLEPARVERLKTAVGEATMNAIEHGNANQAGLDVRVQVLANAQALWVRISDHGQGAVPDQPERPDLEAKLAGVQPPRGWGLFLIRHMVDELRHEHAGDHHTVELVVHLKGAEDDRDAV